MTRLLFAIGIAMLSACGESQTPAGDGLNAAQANVTAPAANQQSSAPGAPAWQHLGADPDQNVGYAYDPGSVRRSGDLVTVLWREDHSQRRPPTDDREIIVEYEINCAARTARELTVVAHLRDGGEERSAAPEPSTPIDPESPLEYLRGMLCGQG